MKSSFSSKSKSLRNLRNGDLLRRMRNGESLTSFNSQSSWYPPRPLIEKDESAINRLYGKLSTPEHLSLASTDGCDELEPQAFPLRLA